MNEEKVKIIELERRDPQSEAKYWNEKYTETLLELFKEKEKNKKLEEVINNLAKDYMNNHIGGEYSDTPCEYYEEIEKKEKCQEKMWDDVCFGDCKECLIQYYFKKARGEENETN